MTVNGVTKNPRQYAFCLQTIERNEVTYEERRKLKKRLRWIVSRAENAIDAGLAACEQGTLQLDAMVSIKAAYTNVPSYFAPSIEYSVFRTNNPQRRCNYFFFKIAVFPFLREKNAIK